MPKTIKIWGFKRPYCNPEHGTVMAKTAVEAQKLISFLYGFCGKQTIYCAETDERLTAKE